MPIVVPGPGQPQLQLEYLLLDVNGTLTNRGGLIPGVAERIRRLRKQLGICLLTADTYGTLTVVAQALGDLPAKRVMTGNDKANIAQTLGPAATAAIGNGANDEPLLRTVALGIAVVGPEGASPRTLSAADVVCDSILTALDLLTDPEALAATLRR